MKTVDTPLRPGEILKVLAPAKVNLTLHVTGQRAGGYHDLDSLVVFTGIGDTITARAATDLSLSVSGPFAMGVPADSRNLVLKAAEALRDKTGQDLGAALTLEKALPHAAGLGSGSSDAAAVLELLAGLWQVPEMAITDPMALSLGADVPVCMAQPRAMRMRGIGERLSYAPRLPDCAMVLVNPHVEVPTEKVFAALKSRANPPMEDIPENMDFEGFAAFLNRQRNDLTEAATTVAPEIGQALDKLKRQSLVKYAGMSGSGGTCIGLVKDMDHARRVARAIQVAEMSWWVVPAPVLN